MLFRHNLHKQACWPNGHIQQSSKTFLAAVDFASAIICGVGWVVKALLNFGFSGWSNKAHKASNPPIYPPVVRNLREVERYTSRHPPQCGGLKQHVMFKSKVVDDQACAHGLHYHSQSVQLQADDSHLIKLTRTCAGAVIWQDAVLRTSDRNLPLGLLSSWLAERCT